MSRIICCIILFFSIKLVWAEYRLVTGKHDFIGAMQACSQLGPEWQLPDGQNMGPGLVNFMKETPVPTAWLSLFRRTFVKWQWVDGVPDENFVTNTKHKYCALLKLTGEIVATTCISQGVGHVCQLPRYFPCPEKHVCSLTNQSLITVDCSNVNRNWYEARSVCHNLGGNLVILDESWKVRHVASLLSLAKHSLSCQKVFVGLHREDWLAVDPKDEGRILFTTKWENGEPSPIQHRRCAVAGGNEHGKEVWNARSCLTQNNVICYRESPAIPSTTKTTTSTVSPTKSPTPSAIEVKVEPSRGMSAWVVACICVVCVTVVALVVIFILYKYVKGRKKSEPNSPKSKACESETIAFLKEEQETILRHPVDEDTTQASNEVTEMTPKHVDPQLQDVVQVIRDDSNINVLLCCEGSLSCKDPKRVQILSNISFGPRDEDVVIRVNNLNMITNLVLYQLYCSRKRLDLAETKLLLEILEEYRLEIDIAYLPALTFDKDILNTIRNLGEDIVLISISYQDISHETVLESIAFGFVHGDFLGKNRNVVPGGSLDVTFKTSEDHTEGLSAVVYILKIIDVLVKLFKHHKLKEKLRQRTSTGGIGATRTMRKLLIDEITVSSRPNHHVLRGYGLLPRAEVSLGDGPTQFKMIKAPIRIMVALTGCDTSRLSEEAKQWSIQALDTDHTGERDTAWNRGTKAVDFFVRLLQSTNCDKDNVEIHSAALDACQGQMDWDQYKKTLQQILQKNFHIVFLLSGLGRPSCDSSIYNILQELKSRSIVITNSVKMNASQIAADFPSSEVISIRNGYNEDKLPLDSTVDFDCTKKSDSDHINKEPWSGALRVSVLAARILQLFLENGEQLEDGIVDIAMSTAGMREILYQVCKRSCSADGVPIIRPEMCLPSDTLSKIQHCLKEDAKAGDFRYWAGKGRR